MIIANPIYDTVFKRLMENKRIARFFIETIIEEKVEDIAIVPQEYTYLAKVKNKKEENKAENVDTKEEWEVLSLIRFDFVATIRNPNGEYKKVLIEIQKSNKPTNLMRFRAYLGEQYKRTDIVEVASGKVEKALPIVPIYLFGFKLAKIKVPALKVARTYTDIIKKTVVKEKDKIIESLTHNGYFVQIPRIKGKPRTSLEQLLSLFEQQYFIDEKNTIKEYKYLVKDENLKMMVEILQHAAADTKTKREMEEAWWADQDEKEYEKMEKDIQEKNKIIEEKDKTIEEKDKTIEKKDKTIEEKDKTIEEDKRTIEEQRKEIAELKRQLKK